MPNRLYSANGICAAGAGSKTAVSVTATSTIRPGVYDVAWGMTTAPNSTDFQIKVGLSRYTADGTGTAFTANLNDTVDLASGATTKTAHSAEPTYTANQDMLSYPLNQRAPWRWVAQDGKEIWAPATAANGLGSQLITSANSIQVGSTVLWME